MAVGARRGTDPEQSQPSARDAEQLPNCALGVPFLRVLPEAALRELARAVQHRTYRRGSLIATRGEPVERLVVLARGRLKAVQTGAGGREQVVRTLAPGDFVGELGLFAPAVHEVDLVATQSSEVCLLPREAVQALLGRYPEVAPKLVEALARRLAGAERTIGDLALRDVGQRLAAELLRAAERGTPVVDGLRVRLHEPWVEVAARLGTTPESLSRRLGALADAGLIRQERGRAIVLLDRERLRALAEA
jgi:CRP/FNR family transcriptional regulator